MLDGYRSLKQLIDIFFPLEQFILYIQHELFILVLRLWRLWIFMQIEVVILLTQSSISCKKILPFWLNIFFYVVAKVFIVVFVSCNCQLSSIMYNIHPAEEVKKICQEKLSVICCHYASSNIQHFIGALYSLNTLCLTQAYGVFTAKTSLHWAEHKLSSFDFLIQPQCKFFSMWQNGGLEMVSCIAAESVTGRLRY